MDAGYMPVISPVAYDATSGTGGALNVNGDDAAAAIAVSLKAEELLLIADVEGVRGAKGELVQFLSIESGRDLIASGVAAGGMAAKLEAAHAALLAGVDRIRICDLAGLVDSERGTLVTQSQGVVS
jgi:acetylglutamate kinase